MKEQAPKDMMTLEDFLVKSGAVEEEDKVKLHGRNHERRFIGKYEMEMLFQENSTAMRYGGNWVDPMLLHSVGCSRSFIGETSASSSAAINDCEHHDSHHKRAKVPTCYHQGTSYSSAERDYSIKQCSSISSNNGVFYHNFMSNNESDGHHFDGKCGNEEENEGGLKAEDFEIQMDLTDDLLHMVFSFLDHCNLCNATMIFDDICQRYPNAKDIQMPLKNLEALTLGKGLLGDTFFHALTECGMLRSLDVNDAILGDGGQEIPINHDRLCDLKVTKYRVICISIRCPLLKSLSLKRSNMAQLALNCPLLQLLDISACHKLTDVVIRYVMTSCPQLESLDMSNCSCVSDETLQEIARSCYVLHVLNSSYCPNISLEFVRLPMLTILKLDNCEVSSRQPSSISDDAEVVTLIGSCEDAANQINYKEIHWGLLEDSLEERLKKVGGLLSDSEKTKEENKEGDIDETMVLFAVKGPVTIHYIPSAFE
ncbi:hypothetical protein F3Y22_tig00110890pilonHSYRG00715 [Hibiscus syriacus]|uniref:Uncharacterized protein n=1 Tax=Hibiscus syriacus TaxID=106335 RepID=A0A6A2ZHG2_HIBSY|nr:hypothetical protein F3Y22_tig00110890pilonHSYRG00715 [Hibiscus syriacus]